jgi:YcxB-like protein
MAGVAHAGLAFGVLWFTFMLAGPWFSSRHQFRNTPAAHAPITLDVSGFGLEIHSSFGDSKIAWPAYVGWSEGKSVFVILPQPRIYVPVPKRAFTPEQLVEFRDILERSVTRK